jgi:glycosyltransferase involved in cell wall biosynthesis
MSRRPGPRADPDRLHVTLPMLTLVPGSMGGSEVYARELTRALPLHPDLDVTTIVSGSAAGFSRGGHEVVATRLVGRGSTLGRLLNIARSAVPAADVRRPVTRADVVHYPLSVPVPRRPRSTPMVQTVLDVQHHDLAELFSWPERAYRSLAYDRPARSADVVITISEFCRTRLVERLGLEPERVRVAHLGVDADAFSPQDGPRESFVLYPARGWPHKNHGRLVAAVERLRVDRPDLRLVLTGGGGAELGPLPDWVDHRGLVPDDELADLYRRAACLAFPSRYEGFGLPPLEAMASGCPVAAASSGSLPEVCGDAAVMFDPDDVVAMAAAIGTAIASRERLVPLGLRRIRAFTWQACAAVHADVYRGLARA